MTAAAGKTNMAASKSGFDGAPLPDSILTVMGDMVIDLNGLSATLNAEGENQSKQSDADILKALEYLRKEGQVHCKIIATDKEGCRETKVYWAAHRCDNHSLGRKTPVVSQRSRTPTLGRTTCSTPKSSGLRSRILGSRSTPTSQFVSPVLKHSSGDQETVDYEQTPKRMKYSKGIREKRNHQQGSGVSTKNCSNAQDSDHDRKYVLKNPERLACESRDGAMEKDDTEKDMSTKHSLHKVDKDNTGDKMAGNMEQVKYKLMRDIQGKEERLRKLNMVRKYRTKNNLDDLQVLIDKWRHVSQEAAGRLLDNVSCEQQPNMAQLLAHLQIDHKLIQYSAEDEDFY